MNILEKEIYGFFDKLGQRTKFNTGLHKIVFYLSYPGD